MDVRSNFAFLAEHEPLFLQLANAAEQVFAADPNTTLIKLRQLGEALAQDLASRAGIEFDQQTSQADLLYKVGRELQLDHSILKLFHVLRIEGNKATHQFHTQHREALDGLKVARGLCLWYHQAFGNVGSTFKPGPFVTPNDPSAPLRELQTEIEQLKTQLSESKQQAQSNAHLSALLKREAEEYAVLAEQMDAESRRYKEQANAHALSLNELRTTYEHNLVALKQALANQPQQTLHKTQQASQHFDLSEDLTRILIDQQLADAGWEADSLDLTYANGTRPEKGKNRAIAEWPTSSAKACADYVLFIGLTPIAIVEAKRQRINISACIPQAERYARTYPVKDEQQGAWLLDGTNQPWADGQGAHFFVPFAFACNGRPFLPQLKEMSGIWFRDLRSPANIARSTSHFYTPDGLLDRLKRSRAKAEAALQNESFAYLKLRDYQVNAIQAVERALANNQRNCLLAMATGTGKTRTIIGLLYRFLKAERFKRILFLVDRSALGTQAADAFHDMPLEQNQTLTQIYDVKELGEMATDAATRVQVATVQAMVRRIFQSDTPLPIDAFDCIIVDEAHRGYTLDQEMTEGELALRDASLYLSQYRRVLEHFDACKIGLTATPALHTTEIFGKPVYTYSYREAVADDWLIDHEPPIRYITRLAEQGIHFQKGQTVDTVDTHTGQINSAELEDDLHFDIDSFNRSVITEAFDRVICNELAKELDPFGDEKTMIFCVNQNHANRVKNLLNLAFAERYEDQYNQASVSVITGQSDQVEQLIRRYKNEKWPNIAITVDLLTTGIDVPRITNLVFMRRVRSRILYEQMKGRATRRCDEIGKTVFRIYDPVDLYAALESVDTMKPVVKNPDISFAQLLSELTNPTSLKTPGTLENTSHADDVLDQISQKVMRVLRKAQHKAQKRPEIKEQLAELEQSWGVAPAQLHKHLRDLGPTQASQFIQRHSRFIEQLEHVKKLLASENAPIISVEDDELIDIIQEPAPDKTAADYLDEFNRFIQHQLNQHAALKVIATRPKDLTREQLREVRLHLDNAGFTEANLKSAWRNANNQEIAASIIGYIRQAAIGEALLPFEQRVAHAMQHIYSLQPWNATQRKWLERLAKQLVHEVVLETPQIDEAFREDGGSIRLNKTLDGHLPRVLEALGQQLWTHAG